MSDDLRYFPIEPEVMRFALLARRLSGTENKAVDWDWTLLTPQGQLAVFVSVGVAAFIPTNFDVMKRNVDFFINVSPWLRLLRKTDQKENWAYKLPARKKKKIYKYFGWIWIVRSWSLDIISSDFFFLIRKNVDFYKKSPRADITQEEGP